MNNLHQNISILSKSNNGKFNNVKENSINQSNKGLLFNWKIGTINIRTGREQSEGARMYMVTKQVASLGLLVCSLQEVRHRNSGKKIINLDTGESYIFFWSGPKKRRDAGVGVLIKQCKEVTYEEPDINDPRVMALNIKVRGYDFRLVNAYAPTNCDGSESSKDAFYRMVRKSSIKQYKHQKLLVNGDFNATTEVAMKQCFYDGKNLVSDSVCNDNGTRLKQFCLEKQLCMSQTFYKHDLQDRFTWFNGDMSVKKVLDYILVDTYTQQFMKECKVDIKSDFDSDHRLLMAQLETPTTKKARRQFIKSKNNSKFPKIDSNCLKDTQVKTRFINMLSNELDKRPPLNNNADDMGKSLIKCLQDATSTTLVNKIENKGTDEIWKNDKIINSLLETRKVFPRGSSTYKSLTKMLKARINKLKNEKLAKEALDLNQYASQKQVEHLYRTFKSDNSSFKTVKTSKKCEPHKLKEFFRDHFKEKENETEPPELEDIPEVIHKLQDISTDCIKTGPPDMAELKTVIQKLKNGKSANDISIDFIKHALDCNHFAIELLKLYQTVWSTNMIPKDWGHTKLVALWKGPSKGKPDDPSTYRGLQIGSSFCKIIIILIINRWRDWYEKQLMDQQQGFRRARGTSDGIFIVKEVQQISEKMKKPVYALFVDLSAAFDHVCRKWMFKSIKKRHSSNSDKKLIELLETLYKYTTTALAETPEDKFELDTGVRQGGPESPLLYNLYMDFIMRIYLDRCKRNRVHFLKLKYNIPSYVSSTGRTSKGEFDIDWTGYADDLVLMFNDSKSLQKGINILNELFTEYGMSINVSKTKTMIFNHQAIDKREYPSTIASLSDKALENVKIFRYLGCDVKFDEPSTGEAELNLRNDAATGAFYAHSRNLMNHRVYMKTRVMMLNSLVRSRLVYGCQTWNCNKTQVKRLNAAYMGFIRRMVKGGFNRREDSWSYRYTNNDLMRISDATDLCSFIEKQQINYVKKILKNNNESIAKRLLLNDNESRKPGPQRTLLTSVLKTSRCTLAEFMEITE